MQSNFTIEIDNITFEFLSMNVNRPQLFQMYIVQNGAKVRYHIKADGNGNFVFALHDEIPAAIVKYEQELSQRIKQLYNIS